jgi:hypothetical protein
MILSLIPLLEMFWVEQKIDFKNKELHDVNQKIIKHEYVGKAIAQSEVLLQQKHPAVTPTLRY